MQKLMKNWIFTMVTCILLAVLAVLMFLSGFKVGGMHIGNDILHIVAAVALTIYVIFALFPMIMRYRGVLQGFVIGEVAILLLTAVAHVIMNFDIHIPLLYNLQVCSVVGLALWLRGVVETVHAYLSNAGEGQKRIPLWQLLCYILLSAVGVWQLVNPLVEDKVFIFVIGVAATVVAAIFGYATAMNRKATADERRAKREQRAKAKAEAKAKDEQRATEAAKAAKAAEPKEAPKAEPAALQSAENAAPALPGADGQKNA